MIGAAIGVASIATSLLGSKKSAKAAKEAGKAQAALIREETTEELRRMDRDFEQLKGTAMATIGASGLQMEGSAALVMADLESEIGAQREWTERAGGMRAYAAIKGASATASNIRAAGISQAISTAGAMGQSQGWWK